MKRSTAMCDPMPQKLTNDTAEFSNRQVSVARTNVVRGKDVTRRASIDVR